MDLNELGSFNVTRYHYFDVRNKKHKIRVRVQDYADAKVITALKWVNDLLVEPGMNVSDVREEIFKKIEEYES